MRLVRWFIQLIFWLQAFAAPLIFFSLIAIWVYSNGEQNKTIAIVLLVLGVITGILAAEYIRRKIGLDTFFARIYGPADESKQSSED